MTTTFEVDPKVCKTQINHPGRDETPYANQPAVDMGIILLGLVPTDYQFKDQEGHMPGSPDYNPIGATTRLLETVTGFAWQYSKRG